MLTPWVCVTSSKMVTVPSFLLILNNKMKKPHSCMAVLFKASCPSMIKIFSF